MGSRADDFEMNAVSGVGYLYLLCIVMSLNHDNHRHQNVTVLGAVRPLFLVKLTGYRLVGLAFLLAAMSKFIMSLSNPSQSTTTNSLDLVFGGVVTVA
jgi:hypothetical protein